MNKFSELTKAKNAKICLKFQPFKPVYNDQKRQLWILVITKFQPFDVVCWQLLFTFATPFRQVQQLLCQARARALNMPNENCSNISPRIQYWHRLQTHHRRLLRRTFVCFVSRSVCRHTAGEMIKSRSAHLERASERPAISRWCGMAAYATGAAPLSGALHTHPTSVYIILLPLAPSAKLMQLWRLYYKMRHNGWDLNACEFRGKKARVACEMNQVFSLLTDLWREIN